jgi:glycosyltransferase involved in cell wall biosynthesis
MKKQRLDIWYPYPKGIAPSQRFRIEQYVPFLEDQFEVRVFPFWSEKAWKILYKKGNTGKKIWYLLTAFGRRKLALLKSINVDYVYIHREAAPIGWPVFEWFLCKVMGKKLVYDFDDAIWLPNQSEANRTLVKHAKLHSKVASICKWSYKVSVCNDFLADYARKHQSNVVLIPTTIDTKNLHISTLYNKQANHLPTIGWTGSHSTLNQLNLVWEALTDLYKIIPFEFHLISDAFPENLPPFVKPISWNKSTEIEDLMQFDIGIMPLYNSDWEKGKCAFKLLQYLALEIPAVASDVGLNSKIINNAENGFLLHKNDTTSWLSALATLLKDENLRINMGQNGREKVQKYYSVDANKDKVIALFN